MSNPLSPVDAVLAPGSTPRLVTCPTCGGDSLYAPANPYRPFCSERCKNMDLGAWASERFRMPTPDAPQNTVFGDARRDDF